MTNTNQGGSRLVLATVEMLSKFEWTAFCTFTTFYPLTSNKARRLMEGLHLNITRKQQGEIPKLFWIAELGYGKSDYHIHSLIKADEMPCSLITKSWQEECRPAGYSKHNESWVVPFIKNMHGERYVVKTIDSPTAAWDLLL